MNREEAKELLPWFSVGALAPDEARLVAAHLEDSEELQAELREIQDQGLAVNAAMQDVPELRPEAISGALAKIDALEQAQPAMRREINLGPSLMDRLRDAVASLFSVGGMRVAVAAQFALILVLGGALLLPRSGDDTATDNAYSVASGASGSVPAGGISLDIVFGPAVTEAAMRTLLLELDGEIISGPSPVGVYRVRFADSGAQTEQLLDDLRQRTDLVRFATPAE